MYQVSWFTEYWENQYNYIISCFETSSPKEPIWSEGCISPRGYKVFETKEEAEEFAIQKRIEGNSSGYKRAPQGDF